MLAWGRDGPDGKPLFDGTIRGLIEVYRRDPDSPYHKLRWGVRRNYDRRLQLLERTVGARALAALGGRDFLRWYEKFRAPTSEDARERVYLAHGIITLVRELLRVGLILELPHCARLKSIISELAFEHGAARNEELTAQQAAAIRAKAHELGFPSIALAQALQFELMLRQKDVIGEWVPIDEPGTSVIVSRGRKWLYGLDWREVSSDLVLRHRLSKSLRGRAAILDPRRGKTLEFKLTLYPMVVEELACIPAERRIGPMVVNETTGRPWNSSSFRVRWREIADAVDVPKHVRNMDSRAGGLTEGTDASGGDLEAARHHAGHADIATTQRYSRGGARKIERLAELRVVHRKRSGNDPEA
jgi:hypothetical protein